MGQEEELLRIAKKLEKMVARKKTVRLQSSGCNPRSPLRGRRGACEPRGVPGARAGPAPGRRARDSGTRGRRGWGWDPRPGGKTGISGWACAWPRGAGGEVGGVVLWEHRASPRRPEGFLCTSVWTCRVGGPRVGRAGPGKEWETGAGKGLSEPLDSACAKARGELWRPRNGRPGDKGGKNSWVTREVGRNLS